MAPQFRMPEIEREYRRYTEQLNGFQIDKLDYYFLQPQDVLDVHFALADFFYELGEGMSTPGPRSIDLLLSTVARQATGYGGEEKWRGHFEVCATLMFGITRNHVFYDANKRTALLSCLVQLERLDLMPIVTEQQIEDIMVKLANRDIRTYSVWHKHEAESDDDRDVKFMAWYLRNNTRQIDRRRRTVTYRQLRRILNRFGFDYDNIQKNYCDVVRLSDGCKLCQIGFPGWTREVGAAALKTVRRQCGLSSKDRVDNAAFFGDEEPLRDLIGRFEEPLRRLAHR